MAGIPHDHYEPKTGAEKWLHSRLPIVGLLYDTLMIPTPRNLNWMWIWGVVLAFSLVLQIATGIVLAMHYTPNTSLAFSSVEHIMRNVNGGYMLRYLHSNGASMFFIAVYLHIFRGLYYGSYKAPPGVEVRRTSKAEAEKDTLPFWPYFVMKDLFALSIVLLVFFAIVGFMPNYLGDPINYVEANPLVTPPHIVPEWYFLPFYAILRAFTADVWVVQLVEFISFGIIDAKFFGVIAMFGAIAVMALVPWLDTSSVRSGRFRPMFKWWFAVLVLDFIALTWAGSQAPNDLIGWISLIASAYWFAYFLVILPLLGVIEKPEPQPATIEEDFKSHYADPAE